MALAQGFLEGFIAASRASVGLRKRIEGTEFICTEARGAANHRVHRRQIGLGKKDIFEV